MPENDPPGVRIQFITMPCPKCKRLIAAVLGAVNLCCNDGCGQLFQLEQKEEDEDADSEPG